MGCRVGWMAIRLVDGLFRVGWMFVGWVDGL